MAQPQSGRSELPNGIAGLVRTSRLASTLALMILGLSARLARADGPPTGTESAATTTPVRANLVQLGLAGTYFRGRDELASPLAYQGRLWGGHLAYHRRGEGGWHMLEVEAATGQPTAVSDATSNGVGFPWGESFMLRTALRYGYHQRVLRTAGGRLELFAGGLLAADFRLFVPSELAATYFKMLAWSLNAGAMARYRLGPRHLLVMHLFTPVLTYLVRSPWSIYDDPSGKMSVSQFFFRGELTSLDGYRAVTARVRYEYSLSERWSSVMTCQSSLANAPTPRPITVWETSLVLGLSLAF